MSRTARSARSHDLSEPPPSGITESDLNQARFAFDDIDMSNLVERYDQVLPSREATPHHQCPLIQFNQGPREAGFDVFEGRPACEAPRVRAFGCVREQHDRPEPSCLPQDRIGRHMATVQKPSDVARRFEVATRSETTAGGAEPPVHAGSRQSGRSGASDSHDRMN